MVKNTCLFAALLLLTAVGGLVIRLPGLNRRAVHNDEAVHFVKFDTLWQTGRYEYDPQEYHGPTLYYCTFPSVWLGGVKSFAETEAATYRIIPVVFGVGLILLLWLVADGLGRSASVCAGVLTALSPALVFYSRYYIQEILLIFFTFLVMAAGWRYVRTGRFGWAILTGAGVGFLHATKETCVVTLGAMLASMLLTVLWSRWVDRTPVRLRGLISGKAVGGAALAAILVSLLLFSVCGTNLRGPLDSLRTYSTYFHRAGGSLHDHPWYYYLQMLLYTRYGQGPLWSEGLIFVLGAIGFVNALRRSAGGIALRRPNAATREPTGQLGPSARKQRGARPGAVSEGAGLLRFVAFYTILMTLLYSAIPYKTPWCALGFLHGWILLAGVGAVALVRVARPTAVRGTVGALLVAGVAQLGWQAWRGSHVAPWYDDARNPYVYAASVGDVARLSAYLDRLAEVHPAGRGLVIKAIVPNPWPLPWYLRHFDHVGYWETIPEDPAAPIILAARTFQPELDARLQGEYEINYYGLRRDETLAVYVRRDLRAAFLRHEQGAAPSHTRPAQP